MKSKKVIFIFYGTVVMYVCMYVYVYLRSMMNQSELILFKNRTNYALSPLLLLYCFQ